MWISVINTQAKCSCMQMFSILEYEQLWNTVNLSNEILHLYLCFIDLMISDAETS